MRSELFNVEQLERHAKTFAASHQLAAGRGTDKMSKNADPRQTECECRVVGTFASRFVTEILRSGP